VFLKEVPGILPRRDIDFSLEIIPGVVQMSKEPYRMSKLDIFEIKL
jgi:hypothetical protein